MSLLWSEGRSPEEKKVLIVDDTPENIQVLMAALKDEYKIVAAINGQKALQMAAIDPVPDLILLDIMMPGIDGFELCRRFRADIKLKDTKIIMVSGKAYKADKEQAFALGADAYITKPVDSETLSKQVRNVLENRVFLTFWGVRGTLPVAGPKTIKYGSNTVCVSLEFPRGNYFIFDAGTGIKPFSDYLIAKEKDVNAKIFISHPHLDHIYAFPFFEPLYIDGNKIEILGPTQGTLSFREIIAGLMDGIYFPIKPEQFGAGVSYRDLREESFDTDGIKISTMLLNHPGNCLGYRIDINGKSICYVTDNELYPEISSSYNKDYWDKLAQFVRGTDILITDNTYSDEEYKKKIGWGHSATSQVVKLADEADVGSLFLYHHDPDQWDDDIDAKQESAQLILKKKQSKTCCMATRQDQLIEL